MSVNTVFLRLLGIPEAQAIESLSLYWGTPWTRAPWLWLLAGVTLFAFGVAFFYTRYQPVRRTVSRIFLIFARSVALAGLLAIALQPILVVKVQRPGRPALWLVIDDTESMTLPAKLSGSEQRSAGGGSTDPLPPNGAHPSAGTSPTQNSPGAREALTRLEMLHEALRQLDPVLLEELSKAFRVNAFRLRREEGVDPIPSALPELRQEEVWKRHLTGEGTVTALGNALLDLSKRRAGVSLAGIVLLSDFNQNAGIAPDAVVPRLQVPLYCVGIGEAQARDVAVDLQLPPMMKKDEKTHLTITIRQEGFTGDQIGLRVFARQSHEDRPETQRPEQNALPSTTPPVLSETGTEVGGEVAGELIYQGTLRLSERVVHQEVPYVPRLAGPLVVTAEVDSRPSEVLLENNRVTRDTFVREYFVRVLYVEDEPSWEWRFIKEVFHRDPLVGPEGFRTYLRSADPRVRAENPLFLPTLTLPRKEFFTYDVIIFGDIPATALNRSFLEMVREFVNDMGGGVVFSIGPRFSPGQFVGTPLYDLLPVEVAPLTRLREGAFQPQRTPEADLFEFMGLGGTPEENDRAWQNLGKLVWYYPVVRLRPLASVLLAHPRDTCADGKTPQPLIAAQRVGRGESVYIGFNELWRLRRKYGELYYRQFWGQLIHRLAIRHALGADKRFVVRTDHKEYRSGEEVRLSVEAYDADFHPLTEDKIPGGQLEAVLAPASGTTGSLRRLRLSQLRPGQFEARLTVFEPGEYRLTVHDPLAERNVETTFKVSFRSVEKQQPRRNKELQDRLASLSGGQSCELDQLEALLRKLPQHREKETEIIQVEIWNSWLAFGVIVGCLLLEWAVRKWLYLR